MGPEWIIGGWRVNYDVVGWQLSPRALTAYCGRHYWNKWSVNGIKTMLFVPVIVRVEWAVPGEKWSDLPLRGKRGLFGKKQKMGPNLLTDSNMDATLCMGLTNPSFVGDYHQPKPLSLSSLMTNQHEILWNLNWQHLSLFVTWETAIINHFQLLCHLSSVFHLLPASAAAALASPTKP